MASPSARTGSCPIYLATLAVRQKSQTIRFKTAAEMLETFAMHKGGKEYRRLGAALERIFGATMFFGTDTIMTRRKVVQRLRFNFLREAQIWYDRQPDERVLGDDFENVIVLSDEFYQEVMEHPIPTDLEAVKVLASAPAVLDLYNVAHVSMLCREGARRHSDLWTVRTGESDRLGRIFARTTVHCETGELAENHPCDVARVSSPDCGSSNARN